MKVRINFHCRHYMEMDAEDVLAIDQTCHGADGMNVFLERTVQ